jgi:aryl-alcohol dehydrogenase-like predicted oxidoreductase
MAKLNNLGGAFTLPGTEITINRMGYGAMQLTGPQVFGQPRDRDEAIAVVRQAVESGVNHIDTADFYGPHVVNEILREALYPYPATLTLVTKVGATRGPNAEWIQGHSRELLVNSVEDNLRNLGVDALDVVNLRGSGLMTPDGSSMVEGMEVLAELQQQGKIQHIGLSNVSPEQFRAVRNVAPVVCIQNFYNLANRADDAFIDELSAAGIAYVPFFPLGGFSPLQSTTLNEVAAETGATPMQVALAWLMQRSPNMLLIPGTSTRAHLRENLAAADIRLSEDVLDKLDGVAKDAVRAEFHVATASGH